MFFLQIRKLEDERDQWKQYFDPMKRKLKELEESESGMRISLEKAERDAKALKELNANLLTKYTQADNETKKSEAAVRTLNNKFKVCITNIILLPHLILSYCIKDLLIIQNGKISVRSRI